MGDRPRVRVTEVPAAVRPTVQAARRMVKAVAPRAREVAYRGGPPHSARAMWKIARYVVDEVPVVGIGTYPSYATLFFFRGRELHAAEPALEGRGKELRFLRLRSAAESTRPAVRRLVRSAFRLART